MPAQRTHTFNVGDIIVGIYSNPYTVTGYLAKCKVMRLIDEDMNPKDIEVKYLGSTRNSFDVYVGDYFEVESRFFRLDSEVVPQTTVISGTVSGVVPSILDNSQIAVTDFGNCVDCDEAFDSEDDQCSNEYDDNIRCETCHIGYCESQREYDNDSGEIPCRDYESEKIISNSKANKQTHIVQSDRGFGVEIEVYGKTYNHIHDIADGIDNRIGISGDGSLSHKGFELQFPLINGKQAEEMVNTTCEVLRDNMTKINDDCGYHLHLQCKPNEQSFAYIQRLMFIATIFEDVITSFLPQSRRNNRYCRPLKQYIAIDRILEAKTKQNLEYVWYKTYNKMDIQRRKNGKYDDSRYYGFNFHCYLSKMKHLEVRHHSGTISADKILHWANMHTLLLDAVHREVDFQENIDKWDMKQTLIDIYDVSFSNKEFMKKKTEMFFNFIGLSEKSRAYFTTRQEKFNS